ncbi:FKBP-type peptidyl-prolyl cis-trans isomerase [Fibrella forsythiae]|uniref:Peptidyl-prolyl cis-trans isomerase n=1 Tax=Fibrella forsythiae TaxID=2817061 RepID=A0ABS3JFT2_9BACT|nr:FKBP-type peptidyl-prolyl cis-trans isomerase [Fibrella forsythiae]MBO0948859.1 FKBP-type peptidyl-prolyl cis-trans isomerase [Fibrella forsythiae]
MFVSRFVAVGVVSTLFVANHAIAQVKKTGAPVKSVKAKSAPAAARKSLFSNSQDSLSYSVGYSVAQSMKQQGMTDVNTSIMAKGIEDALKGQPLQLAEPQMQQIMMAYMQKQYAAKNAESSKAAEGNKKIGATFLAENKSKPGVQTTASGLQYLIEKTGTGAKPVASDRVKVHYTGKLIDGKVFDSSVERGPAEFGVTEVIKGWTEVLQLMPVGSKWKVFIPSDIAYGDRGAGTDIGPGSTLIFDIELLDIVKTN